jgi:hypothetical protein
MQALHPTHCPREDLMPDNERPPSAAGNADAQTVQRLQQEHRCQTLVHSRLRRGRCGVKGHRQWHDGRWYCRRHDPDPIPTIRWGFVDQGTWTSSDGRFQIWPEYMGTTRPQGYRLEDNRTGKKTTHDTVARAKRHAQQEAG